MYNRLSTRNSLLPPAIGFLLDSECRTQAEKTELITRSRKLLRFLPRRMYENYLLDSAAIAATVNGIEGFRGTPVTETEVEDVYKMAFQPGGRLRIYSNPSLRWREYEKAGHKKTQGEERMRDSSLRSE